MPQTRVGRVTSCRHWQGDACRIMDDDDDKAAAPVCASTTNDYRHARSDVTVWEERWRKREEGRKRGLGAS